MANMNPQSGSGAPNNMQDTTANLTDQAKQKSTEVVQQAQDTAKSTLEQQKGRAAGSVDAVAQALRQTGQHLHEQNQGSFGQMAEQAAERLEQFSDDLQNKSVDEIIDDVQDIARREPALFLGGAFLLGLLGARFFKASGDRSRSRQMGSTQYGYNQYPRSRGYTQQDLTNYRRQTMNDEYTGTYDRGNYGTTGMETGTGTDLSTTSDYSTGGYSSGSYTSSGYGGGESSSSPAGDNPGASTLGGDQDDEPGSSSFPGSSGSSSRRSDQ